MARKAGANINAQNVDLPGNGRQVHIFHRALQNAKDPKKLSALSFALSALKAIEKLIKA